MEFAPEVDYDLQFFKSIISPINSIIEPLGMPLITTRLSVIMDIFSNMSDVEMRGDSDEIDTIDGYFDDIDR